MNRILQYLLKQVETKKLDKAEASLLIKEFSDHLSSEKAIHPLLHTNTSDLTQQRYTSTFTGHEFFLKDHQVKLQKILPGVIYLEMARAAVTQAMPNQAPDSTLELHNMVWARPVIVTHDKQVEIALFANETGTIDYEVYSRNAEQEIIHAQGQAMFGNHHPPDQRDIEQLKKQMNQGHTVAAQLYAAFNNTGISYGPTHQGVVAVYQGDQQLLAELQLPSMVENSHKHYQLSSILMDSALQAAIGLVANLDNLSSLPSMPFTLNRLTVFSDCKQDMYAWVRYSPDSEADDKLTTLDIDMIDSEGNVCVQMLGMNHQQRNLFGTVQSKWLFSINSGSIKHTSNMSAVDKMVLFLKQEIALQLQKPIQDIASDQNYFELGLTSLGATNLIQNTNLLLQENLSPSVIFEYTNIEKFADYLVNSHPEKIDTLIVSKRHKQPANSEKQQQAKNLDSIPWTDLPSLRRVRTQHQQVSHLSVDTKRLGVLFPELIHLNQTHEGQPVFWIHGGGGGVQVYSIIAQKSQRPFYGIQARGYMTERSPLHGIEAIAAYYTHIIKSIQPKGPYDLGGYSLGGVLAYEVTRQLQELGDTVSSIVMVDSLDNMESRLASRKSMILQAANYHLAQAVMFEAGKMTKTLINNQHVDASLSEKQLLEKVVHLTESRDLLKQTKSQITKILENVVNSQDAYEIERYSLSPLLKSDKIECYFFRNKSGLFFGELEPHFLLSDEKHPFDHSNYWSKWQKLLPKIDIFDVDSSNHMLMLSEPKVCETIIQFCSTLYSKEAISEEFLAEFKTKTKRKHGVLEPQKIQTTKADSKNDKVIATDDD